MKSRGIAKLLFASAHFLFIITILTPCLKIEAAMVTIPNIPAYYWYHGCTPTAMAAILGHWDIQGYTNLFKAQGNDLYLTANVQDEISSPAHNAKYDSTPDDPNLPTPPKESIADWIGTSVDPVAFGGTYIYKTTAGFVDYAAYKGYTFQATRILADATWTALIAEVDLGRPMLFYVDSNGDGTSDHTVPVFGYDDRGIGGQWYACYTTWSEDEVPVWKEYQNLAAGNIYGVYGSTQVIPPPLPEPSTIIFILLSSPLIFSRRKPPLH